jgi:dTDP-4-amino-4,6-dideoxygalactose transaminase
MSLLPIMRPKLPSAERLVPYLSEIDSSRIYSNYGPLSALLEQRLAAHYGGREHTVITVANGTLGLALALGAQAPPPGTLCVIPAWTFIASAQAAVIAGLVPFFVDVDPATWALDPSAAGQIIHQAPAEVGAVMPVMPFGRPIDFGAWDRFRASSGLAVVIDAAAGFDSLVPTDTPAVVSLHATKVLGAGEGGFVVSTDPTLIRSIRARGNFGFDGKREAMVPGLNAKLSEYHAAVGNAALDEWPEVRADWVAAIGGYRRRLAGSRGVRLQEGFGDAWVSSVCLLELAEPKADQLEQKLKAAGIDTRRWWANGAHDHASTRHLPRKTLPVTDQLARSTIGVPLYRDMKASEIDQVIDHVLSEKD